MKNKTPAIYIQTGVQRKEEDFGRVTEPLMNHSLLAIFRYKIIEKISFAGNLSIDSLNLQLRTHRRNKGSRIEAARNDNVVVVRCDF